MSPVWENWNLSQETHTAGHESSSRYFVCVSVECSIFGVCNLFILSVYNYVLCARDADMFYGNERSKVKFGSTCSYPLICCQVGSQLGYPFNQLLIWEHVKLPVLCRFLSCDASHFFFALVYICIIHKHYFVSQ